MNDTYQNACNAARRSLESSGIDREDFEQADYDRAAAAYIDTYVEDHDIGALIEILAELPDDQIALLFELLAEQLHFCTQGTDISIGEHLTEAVGNYLTPAMERIANGMERAA